MGHSPLHWAVLNNKLECVETLLTLKADPNDINNRGQTPFDIAVEYSLGDLVKCLSQVTKLREEEMSPGDDPEIHIMKERPGKEGQELMEEVSKLAETPMK